MDELPDLKKLSVAEKDRLIRELWPLRALVWNLVVEHETKPTPAFQDSY